MPGPDPRHALGRGSAWRFEELESGRAARNLVPGILPTLALAGIQTCEDRHEDDHRIPQGTRWSDSERSSLRFRDRVAFSAAREVDSPPMADTTRRSTAATLAIVAAAIAFFVQPVAGFFLGLLAILLGVLGLLGAFSPKVKGGLLSVVATLLGAVAVVVKIIEGALRLIF